MSARPWRDAASLIMFAKRSCLNSSHQKTLLPPETPSNFDYKLLMLRRSGKSKFMPNAYVFPGGVSSVSDLDKNWTTLLDKFGTKDYKDLIVTDNRPRPFLLQDVNPDELKRDLAFRICALRETFEESGVFLHTPDKNGNKIPAEELAIYRPQVFMEPENFIKMCLDFEVCPDVWSLNDHVSWLTPLKDEYGQKRYDTMFYTAFLDDFEAASLDDKEITDACWTDPQEMLDEAQNEKLWLAPPQVYELSQLSQVTSFEDLKDRCEKEKNKDLVSWMPIFKKCSDATVAILPGDELYPEIPDYEGKHPKEVEAVNMSMDDFNQKYPQCNRMAIYSRNNVKPYVTCHK